MGNTQDSNYEVKGLQLGSLHIDAAEKVMLESAAVGKPGQEQQILISITVGKDIAASAVTELQLFPPKEYEIDAEKTTLSGLPTVGPMEWDAPVLKVGIKRDSGLYRGTYSWQVTVRHPGFNTFVTGFDTTWQIKALQDDVTRYEHVMEGYRMDLPNLVTDAEGDAAPAILQAPSPPASSASTLSWAALYIVGVYSALGT